jgi:hypothetical protein
MHIINNVDHAPSNVSTHVAWLSNTGDFMFKLQVVRGQSPIFIKFVVKNLNENCITDLIIEQEFSINPV